MGGQGSEPGPDRPGLHLPAETEVRLIFPSG